MRKKQPIHHPSDLTRDILLAKCPCRQIVRVPVEGCTCLCGQPHTRKPLAGKVRQKVIEGEG